MTFLMKSIHYQKNAALGRSMRGACRINVFNKLAENTGRAQHESIGYRRGWCRMCFGYSCCQSRNPSTLQDIKKGQRTEIDTLNGCILRLGRKYSIPTPAHAIIVELTKGLEDVRCLK